MGISAISMAIVNSKLLVYQRVYNTARTKVVLLGFPIPFPHRRLPMPTKELFIEASTWVGHGSDS